MTARIYILGALIAVALQTGFLGKILYDRAQLLRNGQEVVLQSRMVDPRDLFRGHYVRLDLSISSINSKDVIHHGQLVAGKPAFVVLKKGPDGFWIPAILRRELATVPEGPVLRGKVRTVSPKNGQNHRVDFPFDRFFAPKDKAKKLEKVRNQGKLGIIVALDGKGGGMIKGIQVNGKTIYNEPLI